MKKYLIVLAGIIIIAVVMYVLNDKFIKNNNNIVERNNMKIELINPIDKRVLTKQGEDILVKAIQDGDFSTEVANTSYDEWGPLIEKGISLRVDDTESRHTYIIPTGLAHWSEGQAFVTYPDPNDAPQEGTQRPVIFLFDKIQFNNFNLFNFLNEDRNAFIEQIMGKRKVSYTLQYSGSDVMFQISVNDKQIKDLSNTKNDNTVWGGGNFNVSIPINKYLTFGKNKIRTKIIQNLSDDANLHAVLLDRNKQSGIFEEGDVDLIIGSTNLLEFDVSKDFELMPQTSIFD